MRDGVKVTDQHSWLPSASATNTYRNDRHRHDHMNALLVSQCDGSGAVLLTRLAFGSFEFR